MEAGMEAKKDEVGIKIDDSLQERVTAYAGREGLTLGEAISALLYLASSSPSARGRGSRRTSEDPAVNALLFESRLSRSATLSVCGCSTKAKLGVMPQKRSWRWK
jgi:hypothetical protein